MMNKKQFIESQKDCASMLGMSLKEYKESLKNLKAPKFKENTRKVDNSILTKLGIKEENLKKRV